MVRSLQQLLLCLLSVRIHQWLWHQLHQLQTVFNLHQQLKILSPTNGDIVNLFFSMPPLSYVDIWTGNIWWTLFKITLVGTSIFGHAVIQGLLFPEVILISFAVSARTRAYPTLK